MSLTSKRVFIVAIFVIVTTFAIWTVTDPKRYWNGENVKPYLLLRPAP